MTKKEKQIVKVNKPKLIGILIGIIVGITLGLIFLMPMASAANWDNVKSYDDEIKTVTIKNSISIPLLDIPLWELDTIAEATLLTDLVVYTGVGYNKIAEFEIETFEDYENLFGSLELYNKESMDEIERQIDFKYKTYEELSEYVESCLETDGVKNCFQEKRENRIKEVWVNFDEKDVFQKGKLTIGLFTNTREGDYVEWIPTLAGVEVDEWAAWSSSLDFGLLHYYRLDNLTDSVGSDDLTNNNAVTFPPGLVGNASFGQVPNADQDLTVNSDWDIDGGTMTFNVWVNSTSAPVANDGIMGTCSGVTNVCYYIFYKTSPNAIFFNRHRVGTADGDIAFSVTLPENTSYQMITGTYDGSDMRLYLNGTLVAGPTSYSGTGTGAATTSIIMDNLQTAGQNFNGHIDEVSVYNRSLTQAEITELYNLGVGCTKGECILTISNILNSPIDSFNTSNPTINFNSTVETDSSDLDNVTLYINDVANETNSSGTEGMYLFTKIFSEQTSTWIIEACNPTGCINSSSRTFTIDFSVPSIDIGTPSGTFDLLEVGTTLHLSGFINDSNLDVCIYEYKGSNNTFSCTTATLFNETITQGISTQISVVIYVNDTVGNENSSTFSWDFALFKEGESFSSSILEGSSSTFTLGMLTNGVDISLANLSYDGTGNFGSLNQVGNNFTITKSIIAPLVDATINKSFFWQITQGSTITSFDPQNQTVVNFGVDTCAVNTVVLFNFTIKDEEKQIILNASNNTLGKVDLQIKSFAGSTVVSQFNSTYTTNSFAVCINDSVSAEKYNIDALIEYSATGYQTEFYTIQNQTLDNTALNQNITLFDLNSTMAQTFKLIIKDASFLPVNDAIVEIHRKYIDEGKFKIVEIPQTDANGETIGNLVVEDIIYKFVIKKFGVIIGTFSDVRAVCQTPLITTCLINFNAFSSGVTVPDFETLADLNFTLGFNETSRVITSQFVIPSGDPAVMFLNVTMEDALGTDVCSDSLTSNAGTLSCVVPSNFGNATVLAKLFKGNVLQAQGQVKMDQDPSDIYGGIQIVLALFVLLSLLGAGLSGNPIFTLISLMVGIVALFAMNLVSSVTGFVAGATILFVLIAIILVIIKGSNRS